jgi:hypothetical protein
VAPAHPDHPDGRGTDFRYRLSRSYPLKGTLRRAVPYSALTEQSARAITGRRMADGTSAMRVAVIDHTLVCVSD